MIYMGKVINFIDKELLTVILIFSEQNTVLDKSGTDILSVPTIRTIIYPL